MRDSGAWSPFRDTLQLIAEGATEVAGFRQATVSIVVDDDSFEVVALAGDDAARAALRGRRVPVGRLERDLAQADAWGLLRFVPAERAPQELVDDPEPLVVPALEVRDHPDAWHPLDLLLAPFHDADGALRGAMSFDVPEDGLRPDAATREVLQRYAAQACRVVLSAYERAQAAEQAGLTRATREVVRRASAALSLDGVLRETEQALVSGFGARGLWIQTFGGDPDDPRAARIHSSDGQQVHLPDALVAITEAAAHHCWERQETLVVAPWRPRPAVLDDAQHRLVLGVLESLAVHSILFAPLGAGPECLGSVVLTRDGGRRADWSEVECAAMLDLGEDLGRAIRNVRDLARDAALVHELRALDGHRNAVVTELVRELGDPLAAVTAGLDDLVGRTDLPEPVGGPLAAVRRGSDRMARVLDELRLLSEVGDPDRPVEPVRVDLRPLVEEAVDLVRPTADASAVEVRVAHGPGDLTAWGARDELDAVVLNLVSNAVKYTLPGGVVTIRTEAFARMVVLEVEDTGLGISEEDQEHLFSEFFRSTNPDALAEPGTGLGLAIVARVVERHGGTLDLESELGSGSTFRVGLPTPPGGAVR